MLRVVESDELLSASHLRRQEPWQK